MELRVLCEAGFIERVGGEEVKEGGKGGSLVGWW